MAWNCPSVCKNNSLINGYFEIMLKILEEGRQESLPTILCEPDSFGGHSKPPKAVIIRECPHDSLGLLSPLRCFASYAATLIHRIFRIRWLAGILGWFSKAFHQIFNILVCSEIGKKYSGADAIALEYQPGTTAEQSYANNPVDEGSCVALRSSVREREDPRSHEGIPE